MASVLGAPKGMQTLSLNAWGKAVTDQSGDVFHRDSCSLYSHINYYFVRISISAGFVPSHVFFTYHQIYFLPSSFNPPSLKPSVYYVLGTGVAEMNLTQPHLQRTHGPVLTSKSRMVIVQCDLRLEQCLAPSCLWRNIWQVNESNAHVRDEMKLLQEGTF